jgi:hypothetical protein
MKNPAPWRRADPSIEQAIKIGQVVGGENARHQWTGEDDEPVKICLKILVKCHQTLSHLQPL